MSDEQHPKQLPKTSLEQARDLLRNIHLNRESLIQTPHASEGCAVCLGGRGRAFNWQIAQTDESIYIHAYTKTMRHREDLNRGSLWSCERCNELFYLDDRGEIMYHIEHGKADLYRRLAGAPPRLTSDLYANAMALAPINGRVGCAIKTTDGQMLQLAEIHFGRFRN